MRDYNLGNHIYKLRKEKNLTQEEVAHKLGITSKAISKWENGITKPSTKNLKSLGNILDVSIDELLNVDEDNKKQKKIKKIVLTGGPCAGKSTAMSWIQNFFQKKGYNVVFLPESATEIIIAGINPNTTKYDCFEEGILSLQLEKEKIYEKCAQEMFNDKILIVCDRGALDMKAYMNKKDFNKVIKKFDLNEVQLRDSYDAVFHLVSAAKGAQKFYNFDNVARMETIDEAIIKDNELISCWTGHPHLRIIDNSTNFENKMKRLLKEISNFLGEPDPYEIERKFLIKYPDVEFLNKLPNCEKVQIIQTYLKSNNNEEIRLRQRGINGNYTYYQTRKINVNNKKRIETETRLTQGEYVNKLFNADPSKRQIIKDRYCLSYNNQYFEIDIYPFWNDKAITEIELNDENQEIDFPSFLEVIKEVTDDVEYRNSNIAQKVLKLR